MTRQRASILTLGAIVLLAGALLALELDAPAGFAAGLVVVAAGLAALGVVERGE